jgi:hypothetical protein
LFSNEIHIFTLVLGENLGSINSHGVLDKHAEPVRDPSYRTLRSEGEIKRGTISKVRAYASRHACGVVPDDTDEDSEIDEDTRKKLAESTPNTRRALRSQIDEEHTGKIGPMSTFFTLLKGFVATGVLFIPKGFVTGGWLFSSIALFLSC